MPQNPFNDLLFDHIDEIEFFLNFWAQILSYLPLLQEGTNAEFPALGSSHNHPCIDNTIYQQIAVNIVLFLQGWK